MSDRPKKQFCLRGHDTFVCGRDTNGRCRECGREYARERRAVVRSTPEGRAAHVENNRESRLKNEYGSSVADYNARWKGQGEKCALCGSARKEGTKRFALDHDHTTGHIRGILCVKCNTALGTFGDNVAGLCRALDYLIKAETSDGRPRQDGVQEVDRPPE